MKKVNKKRKKRFIFTIISFILFLLLVFLTVLYLKHIDKETNMITENTVYTFINKDKSTIIDGLYTANIEDDLKSYIKDHKKATLVNYKIEGEDFYLQVKINKIKDSFEVDINKIIDKTHDINARMTYKGVKKIKYRTGSVTKATIIELITEYDNKFMAISGDNYYFLGTDVEKVSFDGEHFYYYLYNKNYNELKKIDHCSNDLVYSINGFNYNDTFYTYGIVNFLKDYYQKLSPQNFTVWQYCDYLNNRQKDDTSEE